MQNRKKVNLEALSPEDVHPSHDVREEGILVSDPVCQKCRSSAFNSPDKLIAPCEPVTNAYKLPDWTDQWDDCDVCESCEQLTKVPPSERLSASITMLFTYGIITSSERDKARKRLAKMKADKI